MFSEVVRGRNSACPISSATQVQCMVCLWWRASEPCSVMCPDDCNTDAAQFIWFLCVCACVGGWVGGYEKGETNPNQVAPWLRPYGLNGVLGPGRTLVMALLGQGCVPVCPSTSAVMHLGQNLACCPRTTLEWGGGFVASAGPAPRY